MPKRYNNIIHKQFLRSKTIKVILSSMTRIRLTIHINYTHIEDTEVEETTIVDIVTTSHPVRSNAISVINLDASQASI